jgi:ribosomal protein uL22
MAYKYATQQITSKMAKAVLLSQTVSTKQACEVAKFVKGKSTKKALADLENVLAKKVAVPYTQFNGDVGHKKGVGIGAGRYPEKTSTAFVKLIKLAQSNAADLSLDAEKLVIKSVVVQRGSRTPRYGRIRGRTAKVSHIEMVVEEKESKPVVKKTKVAKKVATPKAEAKVEKKVEAKTETKPAEKKVEVTGEKK